MVQGNSRKNLLLSVNPFRQFLTFISVSDLISGCEPVWRESEVN